MSTSTISLEFDPITVVKNIVRKITSGSSDCTTKTIKEQQTEQQVPYNCKAGDKLILFLKDKTKTQGDTGVILGSILSRSYESGKYTYVVQYDNAQLADDVDANTLTQCDILKVCCYDCAAEYSDVRGLSGVYPTGLQNDVYFQILTFAGDLQNFFKLNTDDLLQFADDLGLEFNTLTPSGYDTDGAGGPMTWNVASPTENWYFRFGNIAWISFGGTTGVTSGTADSRLRILLPDELIVAADNTPLSGYAYNAGSRLDPGPFIATKQTGNEIHIEKMDGTNWAIGATTGPTFAGLIRVQ